MKIRILFQENIPTGTALCSKNGTSVYIWTLVENGCHTLLTVMFSSCALFVGLLEHQFFHWKVDIYHLFINNHMSWKGKLMATCICTKTSAWLYHLPNVPKFGKLILNNEKIYFFISLWPNMSEKAIYILTWANPPN